MTDKTVTIVGAMVTVGAALLLAGMVFDAFHFHSDTLSPFHRMRI